MGTYIRKDIFKQTQEVIMSDFIVKNFIGNWMIKFAGRSFSMPRPAFVTVPVFLFAIMATQFNLLIIMVLGWIGFMWCAYYGFFSKYKNLRYSDLKDDEQRYLWVNYITNYYFKDDISVSPYELRIAAEFKERYDNRKWYNVDKLLMPVFCMVLAGVIEYWLW